MSILEMMKVQFYLAASQEEYDKALAWVKECEDVEEIKEVGLMHSTDWVGNPMDTYVFLFTAPGTTLTELSKYMKVPHTLAM